MSVEIPDLIRFNAGGIYFEHPENALGISYRAMDAALAYAAEAILEERVEVVARALYEVGTFSRSTPWDRLADQWRERWYYRARAALGLEGEGAQ